VFPTETKLALILQSLYTASMLPDHNHAMSESQPKHGHIGQVFALVHKNH
jgi:hypothetical protein